jgi:hypothetical protein
MTAHSSRIRRRVTLAVAGFTALALLLPATAGAQEGGGQDEGPVVEAARQVTSNPDPSRLFVIPEIAVHPDDPSRLALVAGDARNGGCYVYTSQDGGQSWSSGVNIAPTENPFCYQRNFGPASDIQWAKDGTLLVAFSGSSVENNHPNGPTTAYVARSEDGGQSFAVTTVAEGRSGVELTTKKDEQVEAATVNYLMNIEPDPTNADVVYVGWKWRARGDFGFRDIPNKTQLAVSTDGGETFGDPVNLTDDFAPEGVEDFFGSDTAMIGVDSQGVAHVLAQERPGDGDKPASLLYWRSTDQGETWDGRALDVQADDLDSPDVAVDPTNDNIYAVLGKRTEGENGWLEPVFVSSTDGGESWSEPVNLSTDPEGYSAYFPGISVAPNGRIDVAWHDYRNDPFFEPGEVGSMGSAEGQRWSDVYYTYSDDAGDTWSPNIRATDRLIDRSIGATFANSDFRGPLGVASANHAAYLTWADTRASNGPFEVEDAYMTAVRHAPEVSAGAEGAPAADGSWLWGVLGAAVALVVAGLVLLLGTRAARGGRAGQPAKARSGPS